MNPSRRQVPSALLIFNFIWGTTMAIERTLSIIKPDAVAKNVIGQIYTRFENAGLRIVAMIQVLEGEGAIAKNRELMGATDPKKAAPGTIRADFAQSIDANAVHGSDAPETAAVEIAYFFPTLAICERKCCGCCCGK